MKISGKWIVAAICLAAVIGLFVLVIKLISGAFALIGGAMDTIIAIFVILALIVIVCWMFAVARKNR